MVSSGRDAAVTIATSGRLLDTQLAPAKMRQNVSKAERAPMFIGPGQEAAIVDLKRHVEEGHLGRVKRQARYLGAQITFTGWSGCLSNHPLMKVQSGRTDKFWQAMSSRAKRARALPTPLPLKA